MTCKGCKVTLFDVANLCSDEDRLFVFLKEHGVFDVDREMICPKCLKPLKYYRDKFRFVCNTTTVVCKPKQKKMRVRCDFMQYAKKDTFFYNAKKPIGEICWFISLWLAGNFKQTLLVPEMKWSDPTVIKWTSFCREVCLVAMYQNSEPLGGEGRVVEINEAKLEVVNNTRLGVIEGEWIFCGFERDTKKAFMVPVALRSKDALLDLIKEWILPGTTVVSDCWKSYDDCLNNEGFRDQAVNYNKNFVFPDSSDPSLHNVERRVKDLKDFRYGREANVVYYFAEYYFHRKYPDHTERFHHFLKYVSGIYPPAETPGY